jgi:hypothetical protein
LFLPLTIRPEADLSTSGPWKPARDPRDWSPMLLRRDPRPWAWTDATGGVYLLFVNRESPWASPLRYRLERHARDAPTAVVEADAHEIFVPIADPPVIAEHLRRRLPPIGSRAGVLYRMTSLGSASGVLLVMDIPRMGAPAGGAVYSLALPGWLGSMDVIGTSDRIVAYRLRSSGGLSALAWRRSDVVSHPTVELAEAARPARPAWTLMFRAPEIATALGQRVSDIAKTPGRRPGGGDEWAVIEALLAFAEGA